MDNQKFVEFMIEKRREKNISQEKMAEIINVSSVTMFFIEKGETEMDINMCLKAAEALGISVEEIFGDGERHEDKPKKKNSVIHSLIVLVTILIVINIGVDIFGCWYHKFEYDNFLTCVVIGMEDSQLKVRLRYPDGMKDGEEIYIIKINDHLSESCAELKAGDVISIHYYLKLSSGRVNSGGKIESIKRIDTLKIY